MVGDIVWAELPQTDLTIGKARPALVVADVGSRDWVLCRITTSSILYDGEIAIARGDLTWGGLRPGSKVRPDRINTVNESVFGGTLGQLTDAKLAEILTAVRALF